MFKMSIKSVQTVPACFLPVPSSFTMHHNSRPAYEASASTHSQKKKKANMLNRFRSWVMLSETDGFVPLPGEQRLYTSPPRTTLSIQTLNKYPGKEPFSIQSSAGCVHLTNRRVCNIYHAFGTSDPSS